MTDNIKEENRFYARYSSVANLQVTDVRVMNIILAKEKTWKKKLAHFWRSPKFIDVSF